jgi:hypothetical protein
MGERDFLDPLDPDGIIDVAKFVDRIGRGDDLMLEDRTIHPSLVAGPMSSFQDVRAFGGGMPSTVIRRFACRPDSRELEVTFVTGRRYIYMEVPTDVAADFRAAFSKGIYFNRYISNRYVCRELVADPGSG